MINREIFKDYDRGIVSKAIDYICNLDDPNFARDYKDADALIMLRQLQAGTLRIKGIEYADVAWMDAQGNIKEEKL